MKCKNDKMKKGIKWYREKIVDMVESIENEDYLFKIYHYILAKHRRYKE